VVSTHLKNMLVKLDHFPRDPGANKKSLKPPTRGVLSSLRGLQEGPPFRHGGKTV